MSFSLIAAIGQNNELGKSNRLVFNIPGDLKFFKNTTMGHPVLMGMNTWRSLPHKLPGREHYIITSHPENLPGDLHPVSDLDQFVDDYKKSETEFFIIGGGSIYHQLLPHCDKLYLTEVHASDDGADTFFPVFDKSEYNRTVLGHGEDNGITYDHVLYERKPR